MTPRVVSVYEVVGDVVDAQLQLVLLEEGQDLIDAQTVIYVLLRPSQDLEDRLSRSQFIIVVICLSAAGCARSCCRAC